MTSVEVLTGQRSALLRVAAVIPETPDACSVVFDLPETEPDRFDYRPGQFLTVRIPSERTGSVARCYSLASSPYTDPQLKVTVKRTEGGYGSNWICDHVTAGAELEVLPPAGVFTPADLNADLLLCAAGSGITPIMSILKSALRHGTGQIVLLYANQHADSVIFDTELRELAAGHPHRFTRVDWLVHDRGFPTPEALRDLFTPYSDYHAFRCGPTGFMDCVGEALTQLGIPRDRSHAEVFTSLTGDPFAAPTPPEAAPADDTDATVAVELDGQVHELTWPRTHTLVDIMLAQGIDVPYSCQAGECGSCACHLIEGQVDLANTDLLDPEDIADGYILGCQARPITDRLHIQF